MRLVADIGGTNARLALAHQGRVRPGTACSYRNAEHESFASVAEAFLTETGAGMPEEMAIAVAGPVRPDRARLTNHDWHFDRQAISDSFGGAQVLLLNDLAALGHALPGLGPEGQSVILPGHPPPGPEGQALVAGIGTGFNVCSVHLGSTGATCLRAEFGHVSLPLSVAERLQDGLGAGAASFATVEDCFSGAGVSRVHAERTGGNGVSPRAALADPRFHEFYAGLLGTLARELRLAFLPEAGLFFAGSVARAVLSGPGPDALKAALTVPGRIQLREDMPVRLIEDDAAALKGCAAVPL
ncbi:MAG: glucokinase [Pseudooceanicola sp.]